MALYMFMQSIANSLFQPSVTITTIPGLKILKEREGNIPFTKKIPGAKLPLHDPFTRDIKVKPGSQPPLENPLSSSSELSKMKCGIPATFQPLPTSDKPKIERDNEYKLSSIPLHTSGLSSPPETPESPVRQKQQAVDEFPPTPTKGSKGKGVERRSFTMTTSSSVETSGNRV